MTVDIPGLRLQSINVREQHFARAARVRHERHVVGALLTARLGRTPPRPPLVVTITRVGPRALDDDNAVGSAKAVRDAVAAWLGVDDRSPLVRYVVDQQRGPVAVRITIAGAP